MIIYLLLLPFNFLLIYCSKKGKQNPPTPPIINIGTPRSRTPIGSSSKSKLLDGSPLAQESQKSKQQSEMKKSSMKSPGDKEKSAIKQPDGKANQHEEEEEEESTEIKSEVLKENIKQYRASKGTLNRTKKEKSKSGRKKNKSSKGSNEKPRTNRQSARTAAPVGGSEACGYGAGAGASAYMQPTQKLTSSAKTTQRITSIAKTQKKEPSEMASAVVNVSTNSKAKDKSKMNEKEHDQNSAYLVA
ncbi:unnamed protein product [Bursaphelenchus okinawaensis]|uniref:Uncharacterized protein n=1 Tax=Bursaphelenchus okinawaensis TaxID=465554 RepID=A0A811L855_9BILA|nr:unnamed protein product [Bursaphelenchus okinawaensis]CAG9118887.1 unnamed protein product [Bursaphelenchus okinawaensis]